MCDLLCGVLNSWVTELVCNLLYKNSCGSRVSVTTTRTKKEDIYLKLEKTGRGDMLSVWLCDAVRRLCLSPAPAREVCDERHGGALQQRFH